MGHYDGKVVAITGGATGIGFSFAKQFGKEGAKIVIGARRENRLQEAVAKLKELGIEAAYAVCDVTKRDDLEAFADSAWKAFGQVDVFVSNAGISGGQAPVIDMPEENLRAVLETNFFGSWNAVSIFAKRMIEQGTPAAIYTLGSENSFFNAVPLNSAYAATKHGILAMTVALREELPDFIKTGIICPGFVQSEMIPEEALAMGMETDKYTAIAMEQIKAGAFFIVSHAYNMVHIDERYKEVKAAFGKYAPRYDGDDEYDVRSLLKKVGMA